MILEFKDDKIGWVEEGSFDEGETIIFNMKCTDEDDWEDTMGYDNDDDDDDDDEFWDDWFDFAKELDEDELEDYHDGQEDVMDEGGIEVEVTKPPMAGGIIGLILLILGIVILILGIMLGAKAKKSGAHPPQPQQPSPQQQPYYPPPQQQPPQQQW